MLAFYLFSLLCLYRISLATIYVCYPKSYFLQTWKTFYPLSSCNAILYLKNSCDDPSHYHNLFPCTLFLLSACHYIFHRITESLDLSMLLSSVMMKSIIYVPLIAYNFFTAYTYSHISDRQKESSKT